MTCLALAAMLAAGCGSSPGPASAPPSATPSAGPSASPVASDAAPTNEPSAAANGPSADLDPRLFEIMGGDSAELDFRYDPKTTATVASDPGVARDARAIAIGLYTVRDQQPVVDFAIVSVLRVRDATADDAWFRTYRDSYDESACGQAGGIARHAQTVISGHTVFIGGCAGGAFTYHVRVRDGAIVVSITAVGPARLGERLAGDVGD